jgi:predicted nuclease of predicted toxin-antitoxin system
VRVKLDENLPHDLATALRRDGHDVDTVVEERLAGESDPVVVAAATDEGRIVLTLDRGIRDLRRYPPGSHAGILVLRPAAQDRQHPVSHLIQRLVNTHPLDELRSCVVVVEPRKVRIRRPDPDDPS